MSDPSTTPPQNTPAQPIAGGAPGGAPDPNLAYEPPAAGPTGPGIPSAPPPPPAPGYQGSGYEPGYGPGYGYGPTPPPLQAGSFAPGAVSQQDRNWAVAAHLSSFVAAYAFLGFAGPLVVMLTVGNRSPFVRRHAVEALNFNLTMLIAIGVSIFLALFLIGFLLLGVIAILYLAATIAGAVAASRGQEYRYPLTIRFVG